MTDSDLQLCRDWCRANGVEVVELEGTIYRWHATDLPEWFPIDIRKYSAHFEHQVYQILWNRLKPIIQSVRNLDAMETEGPYSAEYYDDDDWRLCSDSGEWTTDLRKQNMSKQSARAIAGILNREASK